MHIHDTCPKRALTLPQAVELKATSILHLGECDAATYPIAKKKTRWGSLNTLFYVL